jgi:hypothetical protein
MRLPAVLNPPCVPAIRLKRVESERKIPVEAHGDSRSGDQA